MTQSQEKYAEYLKSDYWTQVTAEVKKRAGYKCQVCNSPHDLQAHHRTYEHRGRELDHLGDLICLCRRCHSIFHGQSASSPPVMPTIQVILGGEKKPEEDEMILITEQNCTFLRCNKAPYHWMMREGINPKKSGWARRAIGRKVPKSFMKWQG